MDKIENTYQSRHLSQTTSEYDRMELARGKELAEERNATMKDTIKISKQKLYEYVETFFDTIKADPEIYYNKLKRRLQEIGKDRFFEEMARIKTAPARIKKRKEEIAAAKSDEEKRVYREFGKIDEFEFQLFERQDFFLLSYHLLEMWTTQYYMVIQENGLDPERLQQLVFERAAEWFEPPAGWTYKDAEAALEPLREQGKAFDELLARPLDPYALMLNGPVTNSLKEIGPKTKRAWQDPDKGEGKLITTAGTKVTMYNFTSLGGMDVKTHKLFDMCARFITPKISKDDIYKKFDPIKEQRTVQITVKKYMELTGLKDRKEAAKQLKEAADKLYNMSLEFDMEVSYPGKRKKEIEHWKTRILDSQAERTRGAILLVLTSDMWRYFQRVPPMPFNKKLWKVNGKLNPNAYAFGFKLFAHHNMNIAKPNANRISVSTLLDVAPSIPRYEEVAHSDRHFDKRIIAPFERDLDALVDFEILKSWEYCNAKGEPLTGEQIDIKNYDVFSQLLINFELKDYPEQTERIKKMQAAKKSHRPRAKAR